MTLIGSMFHLSQALTKALDLAPKYHTNEGEEAQLEEEIELVRDLEHHHHELFDDKNPDDEELRIISLLYS